MKRKAKTEEPEFTTTGEYLEGEYGKSNVKTATEAAIIPDGLSVALTAERELSEQLRVQLAGCLAAAEGCLSEDVKEGSYGWSLAFEKTRELRRNYEALRIQAFPAATINPEVLTTLDTEEETEFLRESVAGVVVAVSVAYREFVKYLDANFPPWGELPDETKQLYAQSVDYVRTGNAPRSEFERVVRRLLDESPLADRVAA